MVVDLAVVVRLVKAFSVVVLGINVAGLTEIGMVDLVVVVVCTVDVAAEVCKVVEDDTVS